MRHIRSALVLTLFGGLALGASQVSSLATSTVVPQEPEDLGSAIESALAAGRADEAVALVEQQVREGAERRMKRVLAARKKLGQDSAAVRLECVDAAREFTRYILDVSIAASVEEDSLDDTP